MAPNACPKTIATSRWGSACASCASAKARCIRTDEADGALCDRCKRLFKDCTAQVHRPRKKRASKPSRTAQLEERLNGLVDLLRASGELPPAETSDAGSDRTSASLATDSAPPCTYRVMDAAASLRASVGADYNVGLPSPEKGASHEPSPTSETILQKTTQTTGIGAVPGSYNCFAPPRCICRAAEPGNAPAQTQSDRHLLATYRDRLSPNFPYVVVPASTSPGMLQECRPFLWAAIKKVATLDSMSSMNAQMYAMIQHLSEHMLVRTERSLDLLQGIIVVLGWYQHHCIIHAQMHNLIHLAASLVADLGLNRPPGIHERTAALVMDPEEPPPRTNDERRALLAVWYLTSVISIGYQKIDVIPFSPYMRRCMQDLENTKEYDSDTFLLYTIRLQNVMQQIRDMNLRSEDMEDVPDVPRAPTSVYRLAFQSGLDRIQASLPEGLKENLMIQCHIQTAVLLLYEPPSIDAALLKKLAGAADTTASFDALYRSSSALRGLVEQWIVMPTECYLYVPLPTFSQLVNAIILLVRWAKLVGPGALDQSQYPSDDPRIPPEPMGFSSRTPGSTGPAPEFGSRKDERVPHEAAPSGNSAQAGVPGNEELAPVVAALRANVLSQPDLRIDILGILSRLAQRLSSVNEEMTRRWGGVWQNNVWDVSAKKVLVSRAKLERWAKMVSATGGNSVEDIDKAMGAGEDSRKPANLIPTPTSLSSEEVAPVEHPSEFLRPGEVYGAECSFPGWDYPSTWFNNLFDHDDPTLWFDDSADWFSIEMPSSGGELAP